VARHSMVEIFAVSSGNLLTYDPYRSTFHS
jgi:hypothetical protein